MELAVLRNEESYDLNRLKGKLVNVWPYARGYFAPDLPYQLWSAMAKEDALKLVFFEEPVQETPIATHADLAFFTEYILNPQRIVLLITAVGSEELAGLIWFDGLIPHFRATGNYWMRRKYWGYPTFEASRIALDYVFNSLDLKSVWAYTPWLTSVKTTKRLGFDYVTALPESTFAAGKVRDMHVSVMRREKFNHG